MAAIRCLPPTALNGNVYDPAVGWLLPDSTVTELQILGMDRAGNQSAILELNYFVDSDLPPVAFHYNQYVEKNGAGGDSWSFQWSTNRDYLQYKVMIGDCATGIASSGYHGNGSTPLFLRGIGVVRNSKEAFMCERGTSPDKPACQRRLPAGATGATGARERT